MEINGKPTTDQSREDLLQQLMELPSAFSSMQAQDVSKEAGRIGKALFSAHFEQSEDRTAPDHVSLVKQSRIEKDKGEHSL